MDGDQQQGRRRQKQHMQAVESGEGHHADGAFPAEQPREIRPDQRSLRRDLRRDHGAPIGAVVPRQQVSGQSVRQRQQQQDDADHPGSLARLFVSAVQEDLHHMEHDNHDHHAGAPMVQPADQASAGEFRQDIAEAVVGVPGCRRIIKRQQGARERLRQEQENGHAAEDLMPAARGGNVFVEEMADRSLDSGAVVGPCVESCPAAFHALPPASAEVADQELVPWTLSRSGRAGAARAGDHLAIDREEGVMAGAQEFVLAVFPVVGAAEMGALGAEGDDAVVGVFDDPGRALLAEDLPAVDAIPAEHHLDRRVHGQLRDVADIGPIVGRLRLRGEKQIDQRRHA